VSIVSLITQTRICVAMKAISTGTIVDKMHVHSAY
jgi:hypothetical protein